MIYWIKVKHIFLPPSIYFYMIMDLFRRGWGSVMKRQFKSLSIYNKKICIKSYKQKIGIQKLYVFKNYLTICKANLRHKGTYFGNKFPIKHFLEYLNCILISSDSFVISTNLMLSICQFY